MIINNVSSVKYTGMLARLKVPAEQPAPVDGFQPSGQTAPIPKLAPQTTKVFHVTAAQLATQDFRANLASLSAAGVPVEVILVTQQMAPEPVAAPQAPPAPAPTQPPLQQRLGSASNQIRRAHSEVSQAESLLRRASEPMYEYVEGRTVQHSPNPSDLYQAQSLLSRAQSALAMAEAALQNQDPDTAKSAADSAADEALQAGHLANSYHSRERREFQYRVDQARCDAERDRYLRESERYRDDGWSVSGGGW